MTYNQLKKVVRKSVYMKHEQDYLPVVVATVIANRLQTHPVWLMVIAGPSSGKTVFINALNRCPEGIMISMLTPKTLISGAKNRDTVDGKEPSLMARLDGKVMLIKDASTISQMNKVTRTEVFSQLRTAFDGTLEKDTGLGRKEFKAKFGIIIAGTSALEKVRSFESELGERFLNFRPVGEDTEPVNNLKARTADERFKLQDEMSDAFQEYLSSCGTPERIIMPRQINNHAEFLVQLRAGVSRDPYKRYVDHPVDDGMESPFRVSEQLSALYTALLHVLHNEHTALAIIKRIALDSVPYTRMRFMQCLQNGCSAQSDIANSMKMSINAVRELSETMELLGIIDVKVSPNSKKMRLNKHYKHLFNVCTRI